VFGHFRNDLVRLLTSFTGSQQLMERFYQFSQLPWHTDPRDLAVVVLSALALSTLAGIIPALLAARMNPVEALRHE
jgi:lipoprotein-releasing system permease protein